MRKVNCNILSAVDTASQNGVQIDSNQLISASFHFYFGDATAAGTVKLQGSNDEFNAQYMPSDFTVTNWVDLPNASASIVTGASAMILIPQMSYRWIRAVFVSSSGGSSTINCNMFAMSV